MVLVYVTHFLSKEIAKAMSIVPILKTSHFTLEHSQLLVCFCLEPDSGGTLWKTFFFAELSATMKLGVYKFEQLQNKSIVNLV